MLICNQEFNFSVLDADDLDRMEAAQTHLQEADAVERQRPKHNLADQVRGQCRLIMNYLDEVLGEGASEQLGLNGSNFNRCKEVIASFKEAIQTEQTDLQSDEPAPQNRAQRRALAKAHRTEQQNVTWIRGGAKTTEAPKLTVSGPAEADASARVAAEQQAVQSMMDDPKALLQLANAVLQISEQQHG